MDFISFNTTPYNPLPNHRRVVVKNEDPLILPIVPFVPPFPDLGLQNLPSLSSSENKTTAETNLFWQRVALVASRLPPCQNRYNEILKHCQRLNLQSAPLQFLIDMWIQQDYGDVQINPHDERFIKNFEPTTYFPDDMIPEDYKAEYHKWNSLSWCQRYYLTHCIGQAVAQEKKEEDPNIDAWSLQILLCNILSSSNYLREQSLCILSGIDLNVWCDRYLFAGGMIRHELFQASTDIIHLNIPTALNIISSVMGPGEGKISDWVAFFEHFDNLSPILQSMEQNLFLDDALTAILPTWEKLTPKDFKDNKCREGIFEAVVQVLGDKVELKYHGWPNPIQIPIKDIQDERILKILKSFL